MHEKIRTVKSRHLNTEENGDLRYNRVTWYDSNCLIWRYAPYIRSGVYVYFVVFYAKAYAVVILIWTTTILALPKRTCLHNCTGSFLAGTSPSQGRIQDFRNREFICIRVWGFAWLKLSHPMKLSPKYNTFMYVAGLRVSFICIVVGQGNPTRGPE